MKKNNVINVSRQSVLSLLGLILFWFPSSGICQQDKQKQMNPAREIERAEYENSRADRVEIAQIDGRDYYKYYLSPESLKRKFGPSVNLDKYKGYYLQEIPADIDLLADDLRNDPLIDSVDVLGQSSIKVYITEFNFLLKNPSIQLNPEDGQFPGHYLYLIAPNAPYLPIYPSYSSQGTEIAKHRTPYSRSFVNNGSFRTFLSLRPTSYPANGEWIDLPPDEPIPNSVREILETRSNHWSTYYATSIEVNNDGFNAYNYVFNGFENYYLTIGAGQSPGVLNHHHFQRHSTQFDLSSIPDNAEITSVVLDHYLASYYPDERDVCSDCIYDYEEIYPYINSMSHDPIDEYESSGGAWDTRNNSLYNPAWDGSLYYSGSGYIWDRDDGFNEPASFNNAGVSAVQSSLTSDVFSIGIVDYAENDEDPSYWEGVVRAPYYDMLIIDGNGLSAPNPPNNVSASIDDYCDKVRISWNDESGDEDGFRILRDGSEIHETNSNVEYYDDESAAPGVLYEYCVLAFNDVGDSDQDCENGRKNDKPDEPDNVQATGGTYCDRVVVTWDDNSNNEAGFHIYRDGSSINSVQANQESYTDYDAIDGVTHDYCVRAYNDCDESDNQDCDEGWLKTPPGNPSNCSATDGTYPDKVRVDWNTVSEATGYRIYRDGNPIGTDTSPPYDDIGATDCHDYSVVAYNTCGDSPGTSNSDQGSLSGKIQGYVHIGATTNAVQGVSISVRYNSELVGAATSNSDGYYEVSNLPLNRNYEVDPSLQGHEFSPDPANNVRPTCDQIIVQQDFEDISSFSAGGTVTFSGTNCRASNIPIFVDGDDLGIVTDGEGNWSTAVLIGEHCFTSEDPFGWSYLENPICVDIIDNNENLNFTISTNRLLELSLLAGCDAFISDATFLIWEKGETWESSCASWEILSELQSVSISLPPMEYYISYSYNGFSPETPIEVDLRQTDQSAEFRYLTPLYIEILDLPIDADCNIPVIHRGEEHQIRIRAFELVNNVECYVDGVTFSILNLVADEDEWHN